MERLNRLALLALLTLGCRSAGPGPDSGRAVSGLDTLAPIGQTISAELKVPRAINLAAQARVPEPATGDPGVMTVVGEHDAAAALPTSEPAAPELATIQEPPSAATTEPAPLSALPVAALDLTPAASNPLETEPEPAALEPEPLPVLAEEVGPGESPAPLEPLPVELEALPPAAEPPASEAPAPLPADEAASGDGSEAVVPTLAATPEPPASRADPMIQPASATAEELPLQGDQVWVPRVGEPDAKVIGLTVALANGEPITLRAIQAAYLDWKQANVPPGQMLDEATKNQIVLGLVDAEIERRLLLQEACRTLLKDDKRRQAFIEFADKHFDESELPKLLRTAEVKTVAELESQLKAKGERLEDRREKFRDDILCQEFLGEQLRTKIVRPELPELWAYYRAHQPQFQRPAQITWREIVVKIGGDTPAQRLAARKKTEAIHGLLRQGHDFAEVARTQSEGPTASQGGEWVTEPGASIEPAVNAALAGLPLNQPSSVLEGRESFHIVRVEARREAGVTPFVEVQDQILEALQSQQFQEQTQLYIQQLRQRSVIITRLGRNAGNGDPQAIRTSSPPRR